MSLHKEKAFEDELCAHLAAHGWLYSETDAGYDKDLALFPEDVFAWLSDSQPDAWEKVVRPEYRPTARCQLHSPVVSGGSPPKVPPDPRRR